MKLSVTIGMIVFCFIVYGAHSQTVERGSNEGTMTIPASNVMGNGNITAFTSVSSSYGTQVGTEADPSLGCAIGVSDLMQITANASFPDFQRIGTTQVHLQLTAPGNDRLRFFGIAGTADMYLSTHADTLNTGKPEYNAYIRGSLTVDLDWIALNKMLPLKIYFYGGLADNPDLLYMYDQFTVKTGVEWKMYEHSLFAEAGGGFYKEQGDPSYLQKLFWVEPGGRYRFFKKYSLIGSLRCVVLESLKSQNPLPASLLRLNVLLEAPIMFKETNTEAIRTLVFMQQVKEQKKDVFTKNIEQGKSMRTDFEATFDNVKGAHADSTMNASSSRESMEKREEIQKKMDEIERMLEDLQ